MAITKFINTREIYTIELSNSVITNIVENSNKFKIMKSVTENCEITIKLRKLNISETNM